MTRVALVVALAALALAVVMGLVWAVAVRIRNAGIVDVAWAANFALVSLLAAGLMPGHGPRRLLIGAMTLLWSARLASYLYGRVMGHHPVEDGRYARLRFEWGERADRRFFWFFELQGALNLLLSAPLLIASANGAPRLRALEWAGCALWAVALAGESLADRQLDAFRRAAGEPRSHLPRRPVGLLAPSELLLRVARLGGVLPVRARLALGLDDGRLPAADAVLPVPGHRDSRDGSTGLADEGRGLPGVPTNDQRLRALAPGARGVEPPRLLLPLDQSRRIVSICSEGKDRRKRTENGERNLGGSPLPGPSSSRPAARSSSPGGGTRAAPRGAWRATRPSRRRGGPASRRPGG